MLFIKGAVIGEYKGGERTPHIGATVYVKSPVPLFKSKN